MELPDYYAALGVAEDADPAALRRAYRGLARACHPDANPEDELAAERFLAVAAAYSVLHDPGRRADYDRRRWFARAALRDAAPAPAPAPGVVAATRSDQPPRRGDDIWRTLDIPRSLARRGGRLALDLGVGVPCPDCGGAGRLPRACWMCDGRGTIWQPAGPGTAAVSCPACGGLGLARTVCPACRGSGRLDRPLRVSLVIPPGAADAAALRVPGAGQPGSGGAAPGDMVFTLRLFDAPDQGWG